jgi:hypothetical protein
VALSSSYNYFDSFTAANAIAAALRRLGVYDPSETINSTEEANALQVLNLILREWSARGVDVHLRQDGYMFLDSKTRQTYSTASNYFATSHVTTQLDGSHVASDTTLTVDSITGISTTNIILIKLADGTMHATTVNGAPSGTTVTLTTGLTSEADDGAYVYAFTTAQRYSNQIQNLMYASTVMSDSDTLNAPIGGTHSEVTIIRDAERAALSTPMQTGRPTLLHHRRKPTSSELMIWPVGGDPSVDRLFLVMVLPIMDMDTTTDNFWIPPEAHNALIWQLAAELSSEYGIPENEQRRLWAASEAKFQAFLDGYRENASVIFELDI